MIRHVSGMKMGVRSRLAQYQDVAHRELETAQTRLDMDVGIAHDEASS
jgi:hypothetical protein